MHLFVLQKNQPLKATGSNDQILDKRGCELCAEKILDSKLKIYEGAYHSLHVELSDTRNQFYSDVQNFILSNL